VRFADDQAHSFPRFDLFNMRFLLPSFVLSFLSLNTLSFAKSGEQEKYFNVGVMFSMQQKNIPAKSILNFAAM
jgi:hypothetical protein